MPNATLPRKRRAVHFSDSNTSTSVPSLRQMSNDVRNDTYWGTSEFHTIRMSAKLTTRDVKRHAPAKVTQIDDVFVRAHQLARTKAVDRFLEQPPSALTRSMHSWCGWSIGRGLERYVSETHCIQRGQIAADARKAVVEFSRKQHVSDEDLCTFSRERTVGAQLYARIVGEADATAVDEPEPRFLSTPAHIACKESPTGRRRMLVRQLSGIAV